MVLITGNTYPVKEQLKALGGRWDAANKGWNVPDDKADEARAIVATAGEKKPFKAQGGRRYGRGYGGGGRYRCPECGRMNRYDNGGHCGEPCGSGD